MIKDKKQENGETIAGLLTVAKGLGFAKLINQLMDTLQTDTKNKNWTKMNIKTGHTPIEVSQLGNLSKAKNGLEYLKSKQSKFEKFV